jgi:hypothetical protein
MRADPASERIGPASPWDTRAASPLGGRSARVLIHSSRPSWLALRVSSMSLR